MPDFTPIISRFEECRRPIRLVATGSSNTERTGNIFNAMNWVDWVDSGCKWYFGRQHITINTGISGNHHKQILDRYETDVEMFDPFVLFITCGGNDSNPEHGFTPEDFRGGLIEMIKRARNLENCNIILQTYYQFDKDAMAELDRDEWMERFPVFMQVIRDVAEAEDVLLIDHLPRWERLEQLDEKLYKSLMNDAQHLNALGNMIFGLDVLRYFGVVPINAWEEVCAEGMRIQKLMDDLAT